MESSPKPAATTNESLVYHIGYEPIEWGDTCEEGSQLRPHVVWFGEAVPFYPLTEAWARRTDIFIVVGTSASGLSCGWSTGGGTPKPSASF